MAFEITCDTNINDIISLDSINPILNSMEEETNSYENNSNENYGTFDEGTPNSNFGFDLIGKSPVNTQIERSVYNPNNNTYTVKIVKKYEHITGNKGTIFNYVLGVKADIDNSGVYLKGLSVKGSVDLALLGSG